VAAVAAAGVAANGFEELIRLGGQTARNVVQASLFHVVQGRGRPDQEIGIPDGRHAVILGLTITVTDPSGLT
jgi:hypothetical protein